MKNLLLLALLVGGCVLYMMKDGLPDFGRRARNGDLELKADDAKAELVVLYYRVAEQQTKQVKSRDIEDAILLLKKLRLSYVCGPSYYEGRYHVSWVPLGIHDKGWQLCFVQSESRREKIIKKMTALGIETSITRPAV